MLLTNLFRKIGQLLTNRLSDLQVKLFDTPGENTVMTGNFLLEFQISKLNKFQENINIEYKASIGETHYELWHNVFKHQV